MYCPPLTDSVAPVMKPASSLARKATARAISSGLPSRPTGMPDMMDFMASAGTAATMSVSNYPGATAFTVMPLGASSRASALVNPRIPAFAAA